MTVFWKYFLVAALTAGAMGFLVAAVRAAAANVHRLRTWRRFPAKVTYAVDPVTVKVQVGSGPEPTFLDISRTDMVVYSESSKVTVIENPKNPEERRLTGFFDLWNETLVTAIFGLALVSVAWLIGTTTWGVDAVWSGGAWKTAPAVVETLPDIEVFEPRESWKANLFWGCVLGLPLSVPTFFVGRVWKPWPAIVAVVGIGIFVLMVQNSVLNYSRTVRLSQAGLQERSFFGSRQIAWEDLGKLEFRDVRKLQEDINNAGRWQTKKFSTMPRIDVWVVKDREGSELFTLPSEMTPPDTFKAMRERINGQVMVR